MSSKSENVRVRFAPSPTGVLHIGGVRTALFNWLYAKNQDGKFLIRIEDTDTARSEKKYVDDILNCLQWLGLKWDEDLVFQSDRSDFYENKTSELLDRGLAYRCYCTEEEVNTMREQAIREGKKPRYNRKCRDLKGSPSGEKPFVVRIKLPLEGSVSFRDELHGEIQVSNQELDDFILVRSNGSPTYNLVVVLDDGDSKISHVIRGDDHINNTPKQVHLYQAFGYSVPRFVHLPMILGPDKKKLSKRHGDVSANVYRERGFLPEAILNFLVRLGWSYGDQEVFSIEEMIQKFSFQNLQKSSAVFNEEKLLWLNGEHLRKMSPHNIVEIIKRDFGSQIDRQILERIQNPIGMKLVSVILPRIKTVKELVEQLIPICRLEETQFDLSSLKWDKKPELKSKVVDAAQEFVQKLGEKIRKEISSSSPSSFEGKPWGEETTLEDLQMDSEKTGTYLKEFTQKEGLKVGEFCQPIRLAITGLASSPGVFDLLPILPWWVIEQRVKSLLDQIR